MAKLQIIPIPIPSKHSPATSTKHDSTTMSCVEQSNVYFVLFYTTEVVGAAYARSTNHHHQPLTCFDTTLQLFGFISKCSVKLMFLTFVTKYLVNCANVL